MVNTKVRHTMNDIPLRSGFVGVLAPSVGTCSITVVFFWVSIANRRFMKAPHDEKKIHGIWKITNLWLLHWALPIRFRPREWMPSFFSGGMLSASRVSKALSV